MVERIRNWWTDLFGPKIPPGAAQVHTLTQYFSLWYPKGMNDHEARTIGNSLDMWFERYCTALGFVHQGYTLTKDHRLVIWLVSQGWLNYNFGVPTSAFRLYGFTTPENDPFIAKIMLASISEERFYHELTHAFLMAMEDGKCSLSPAMHEVFAVAAAKSARGGGPSSPTLSIVKNPRLKQENDG